MNRRRGSYRSIPPWWANPLVFIPVSTALAFIVALGAVVYVVAGWPP